MPARFIAFHEPATSRRVGLILDYGLNLELVAQSVKV
jgi:hypothetical protein